MMIDTDLQPDPGCPFCNLTPERAWLENRFALALWDAYPVAEGHTLVIPRRHVVSVFDAPDPELTALWTLVAEARARLREEHQPDGFTLGINDGLAAGQTVPHGHIHIIPRRFGDVPEPRGGIRWLFPENARYWSVDR